MSFMAVAYVPAFLEDRAMFVKERANGLYGPTAFLLSNFLIGLPFLFLISVLFSTVAYWLMNMNPTGPAFMTWIMWLFLDLLAAESLVVLLASLFPNFVVALALIAFAIAAPVPAIPTWPTPCVCLGACRSGVSARITAVSATSRRTGRLGTSGESRVHDT